MLCVSKPRPAWPAFFGAFWWLFQPGRWETAFNGWTGGNLWWIWPVLGIIFIPWTTIMFVHRGAGRCERLGLASGSGIALFGDIAWYGGGAGRKRIPNYQGY